MRKIFSVAIFLFYIFSSFLYPLKALAQREINTQTLTYAISKMGKDDTGFFNCVTYNLRPEDHLSADNTARDFMMRINTNCHDEIIRFYNKCLISTGLTSDICLGVEGTIGPMIISLKDGNVLQLGSDGHYYEKQ